MSTPTYDWAVRHAHIKNEYVRDFLSEFFGTGMLLFYIGGAACSQVLLHDCSHGIAVAGVILGLMTSIMIFAGVSGAHINPAISLGLAVAGHLKWVKLPLYIISQILGGYFGFLLAYGLHKDHLQFNYVKDETLSIPDYDMAQGGHLVGAMSPAAHGTALGIGMLNEIILTAILLMAVMAVIDKGNLKYPTYMVALTVSLTVASLALTHGGVSGSVINPARDLCPRLAAYTLGWDREFCFQNVSFRGTRQEWWTVGVFGPFIGAAIGVLLYNFIVGAQLTNNKEEATYVAHENNIKSENGDWRSTMLIPRTGAPPSTNSPYHDYNGNNNNNGAIRGQFNPGYQR